MWREWEGLLSTLSSSQSEIRSVWPGMAFVIHWPGLHKGELPSHSPTGVRQHRGEERPSPQSVGGTQMDT